MNKEDLLLIGAGGHSISCIDVIEQEGRFRIAGLVGTSQEVGSKRLGYEVLSTDSELSELAKKYPYALIAVGQIQRAEPRINLFKQTVEAGFILPTVISASAYVSPHAEIGEGTIVMHGAVINAGAVVGKNCIINNLALLDHDSRVADHSHISTGAIINGNTSIGAGSFIGSGCVIKEGVSVDADSLVGMGVVVRHNLPENSKFFGEVT